jgi:predicted enzyme related to lactoylglutathione lyase
MAKAKKRAIKKTVKKVVKKTIAKSKAGIFNSLDTVWVWVRDFGKAVDWYRNNLGFKLNFRDDNMGWCELATGGGTTLGLNKWTGPGDPPIGGGAVIVFGSLDALKTSAELKARGVWVEEPREYPEFVRLIGFKDLEGNYFQIAQDLTKKR